MFYLYFLKLADHIVLTGGSCMPKACQMVLFFRETTVFSDEDANLEEICEFTKTGAAWSLKITLKATF